jgi:hypothetical protein
MNTMRRKHANGKEGHANMKNKLLENHAHYTIYNMSKSYPHVYVPAVESAHLELND